MLEKGGQIATVHMSEEFLKLLKVMKQSNSCQDHTSSVTVTTPHPCPPHPPGAHTPASLAPATLALNVEQKNGAETVEFFIRDSEVCKSVLSGWQISSRHRQSEHSEEGEREGTTTYTLRDIDSEALRL